jgi:hypothetical protein
MAINKATPLRRLGMSMLVTSLVYSAAATAVGRSIRIWEAVDTLLLLVGPTMLGLVGALILYRGRQYGAVASTSNFRQGSPSVLYLRPFRSDTTMWRFVWLGSGINALFEYFATREEQLAEVFRPFGRFVAIGRPGERLPLPGAARIYVSEWRTAVTAMMQRASLIVLEASVQPGVLWELWQVRRTVPPHRLIILLGSTVRSRKRYEEFRVNGERLLGLRLPTWPLSDVPRGYWRYDYRSWFRGYIYFTRDGAAHYVPLFVPQRMRIYRVGMLPNRRALTYSLWPVYQALGVHWARPRESSYGSYAAAVLFGAMPATLLLGLGLGKILY